MVARAIIRIGALPDSSLRRTIRGEVDAAARAARQATVAQERAAKAAVTAQQRAAKAIQAAREKAAKATTDAERKAATEQEREARKLAQEEVRWAEWAERQKYLARQREFRESEKTARAQLRLAEKASKHEQRITTQSGRNRRRMLVAAGGAAFGAAKGAAELVGRGQGLAGAGSLEERLSTAGDFREKLIRSANEAGVSAEDRQKAEAVLLKASEDTNISVMDLVQGLSEAQVRFDKFREFAVIMDDIARVSASSGESVNDLVGAIGTATQVFQLDEAGQRDFIDALVATSARGTIGVGDVSRDLAPTMGNFQIATGRTGAAAAREFLATAQVVGTSQAGAAESATMIERFMQELNKIKVQKNLKRIGVDVTEGGKIGGKLKNVGDIVNTLSGNDKFAKPAVRQAIFEEIRGRKGAEFMVAALQRNPELFTELERMKAGAGSEQTAKGLGDLKQDPMFRLRNIGVHAQTDTLRDANRIVEKITPAVTELTKLQVQFPLLTESMGALESTIRWAVGALIAERVLGGGGGVAGGLGALGAANAASKVGGLGAAFGAAGLLGKLGMIGAVGGAGAAGYGLTTLLLKLTGGDKGLEGFGESLFNATHRGGRAARANERGIPQPEAHEDTSAGVSVDPGAWKSSDLKVNAAGMAEAGALDNADREAIKQLIAAMANKPEAKLTVKVEGPGRVTSSTARDLDLMSVDNGFSGISP